MFATYESVVLHETRERVSTGWLPPLPDLRDCTEAKPEIAAMAKKLGVAPKKSGMRAIPSKVDLTAWCSPIENQRSLGSCTAHAGVGVVEYFQRRAFGKHIEGSRLFVYKATRNLMRSQETSGHG